MGLQIPPTSYISQLPKKESGEKLWGSRSCQLSASAPSKRIRQKIMELQILPTFCNSSLKKNPCEKSWGSKPCQLSVLASSLKKNPAEYYWAPDRANFMNQLPQKDPDRKLWGSRSRQLSASAPSKRILAKIMGLQIPPTILHQPAPIKSI